MKSTTTRICTKSEMIAGIAMEHAIIQRDLNTRKWDTVKDPTTGDTIRDQLGRPEWVEVTPGKPTGDIAFCPENSGMKAVIHANGRVTLGMLNSSFPGEFLDITVKGDIFEAICKKGIKALHENVMNSGLKD